MGSRVRRLLAVAGTIAAAILSTPLQEYVSAIGPGIVISEFRLIGPHGSNDEFIELFNASDAEINLSGWTLRGANNADANTSLRVTIGTVTLQPGCHYLLANNNPNNGGGYSGTVTPDMTYSADIIDDGGVAILRNNGTIVDQAGFFNTTTNVGLSAYFEGTRINVASPLPLLNQSYERTPDPAFTYRDTGDNAADFALISTSRPQNRASPCARVFKFPNEIQGAGPASPIVPGTDVIVRGIVTSLKSNGFFMQTEPANDDGNPNTSEGLFVEYSGVVSINRVFQVTGKVSESGTPGATMTSITAVSSVLNLQRSAMRPAPTVLTAADLSSAGAFSTLERYEGMRVSVAQLTAVSGSDQGNAFFAVRTGQPRPFREPGVHVVYPPLPCAQGPCDVPVFDGNPELLRVDADGIAGVAPVTVSTGAVVSNLAGPLEFSGGAYTLLPESVLTPSGGMSMVAAAPHAADQFTVASLNLGANYPERLTKASLAVRDALGLPDIIGVQGVATAGDLAALAAQVNADAAGAAQYDAHPSSDNAADPLGVGFLVRADRVSAVSTEAVSSSAFDNAPIALRATVSGPATRLPQRLTVISSQFTPLTDIERDDSTGAAVRARRQAQAEALADFVQGRQINDPNEAIVALGDYNAFDFNDGYVDVVGTVRGVPTSADQLALASPPLVFPVLSNPDFINAWAEQYSSIGNGSAQSLDHLLVNDRLSAQVVGLVHPRINADFPQAWSAVASSPLRVSSRDPLVAYFTFAADVDGPVFAPVTDVTVEASSAAGASVTFETPAATDNLDATVTVTCAPASGSSFPLDNTAVTCSAQDAAGNASSVSFTVTVQDTTPPVLLVPSDITAEASSSSGRVVTFSASATDLVTASPAVTCTPASGSTFAVGTTPVTCTASDGANNTANGGFTVTITAPPPPPPPTDVDGRMSGDGEVRNGNHRVNFAFDVKDMNGVERGWVAMIFRNGGTPQRFTSSRIDEVTFSSTLGTERVVVTGVGCLNSRCNLRFEIAASDGGGYGEHGRDYFAGKVFDARGQLLLSESGELRSGSIQIDQSFLKALLRRMAQKHRHR